MRETSHLAALPSFRALRAMAMDERRVSNCFGQVSFRVHTGFCMRVRTKIYTSVHKSKRV